MLSFLILAGFLLVNKCKCWYLKKERIIAHVDLLNWLLLNSRGAVLQGSGNPKLATPFSVKGSVYMEHLFLENKIKGKGLLDTLSNTTAL